MISDFLEVRRRKIFYYVIKNFYFLVSSDLRRGLPVSQLLIFKEKSLIITYTPTNDKNRKLASSLPKVSLSSSSQSIDFKEFFMHYGFCEGISEIDIWSPCQNQLNRAKTKNPFNSLVIKI